MSLRHVRKNIWDRKGMYTDLILIKEGRVFMSRTWISCDCWAGLPDGLNFQWS